MSAILIEKNVKTENPRGVSHFNLVLIFKIIKNLAQTRQRSDTLSAIILFYGNFIVMIKLP